MTLLLLVTLHPSDRYASAVVPALSELPAVAEARASDTASSLVEAITEFSTSVPPRTSSSAVSTSSGRNSFGSVQ